MSTDWKELILQRVDPVELIGQYTALKQTGREWRGRCPFHQEKTPSFYLNAEKGLYRCHGCRAGGNIIDFYMQAESVEFLDALEALGRRYGVPRPAQTEGQVKIAGQKERMYALMEAATTFFRHMLRKDPLGEGARAYLKNRGITQETIETFDLGYAPNAWSMLTDKFLAAGVKSAELIALGLIKERESGGGHYDIFRHRLIFPIRTPAGRVVAFGGRALDDTEPKYLNSPSTPLYEKSRVLYNLDRARTCMHDEGAIIVEGYFDVVALHQLGFKNGCAPCGTALTVEQILLLQRYADEFFLMFDTDKAGRKATWDSGKLFLVHNHIPRVMWLPEIKDPGELIGAECAAESVEMAMHSAVPIIAFWLDKQLTRDPAPTMPQIRRLVMELAPLYRAVRDELVRHSFRQIITKRTGLMNAEVAALLQSAGNDARR